MYLGKILLKNIIVCFGVVCSRIWIEEDGWTGFEGGVDTLYFAPVGYSQVSSTRIWFSNSFSYTGFYMSEVNLNLEVII